MKIPLLKIITGLISLMALIFVFNQFSLLYRNLYLIHPLLALLVLIACLLAYVVFILWMVKEIMALPKALILDPQASSEEREEFIQSSIKKLQHNPRLQQLDFSWQDLTLDNQIEKIDQANQVLKNAGMEDIKKQAQTVFLTTAISQNGTLDAFTVLYVLIQLVWRLIKTYDTRPSLKKIIHIYKNVFLTVLMTRSLEDLDLIEAQLEPLIASLFGSSLISMIPGSVSMTNLVVNSLFQGAINALLTLRVGIITIDHLSSLNALNPQQEKRSASLEASKLLGVIIKDGSLQIIQILGRSIKQAGRKLNPLADLKGKRFF